MISKKTLKDYSFQNEGIEGFFNYVVESQINGNNSQVKDLFKQLSKEQKNNFFNWLKSNEIKFNYTNLF